MSEKGNYLQLEWKSIRASTHDPDTSCNGILTTANRHRTSETPDGLQEAASIGQTRNSYEAGVEP